MTTTTSPLKRAVAELAARCDGAHSLDGQGYNRYDADFGRRLAEKPEAAWSDRERRAAWEMLRKYRGQLAQYGIDYDEIPEPPEPERPPRQVDLVDGEFHLTFPYDRAVVNAVKDRVDGRTWNGDEERWEAPATPLAAAGVRSVAEEYDFDLSAEAERRAEQLADIVERLGERYVAVDTDEDLFHVVFPYDRQLKDALKSAVPSSSWNGDVWTVPLEDGAELGDWAGENGFGFTEMAEHYVEEARVETRRRIEASQDEGTDEPLSVEQRLGGTLYPFQRAGVAYAADAERAMIADQMGLGKTIQALAVVETKEAYPAAIVCPSAVKRNWAREAKKWLPDERTVEVLEGTDPYPTTADVVVMNYAILGHDVGEGDSHEFPWVDALRQRDLQSVTLDESHYAKNRKANRSRAARRLARDVPVRLLLTGTPVLNRPNELIHQLRIMDRFEEIGRSWTDFVTRYCNGHKGPYGWDISGASNLEELNRRLRSTCYVRRRKEDVLGELPSKRRAEVTVEIDNRDEYDEARTNLIRWLRENVGPDAAESASKAEQLARITHLKKLVARGKLAAARNWIDDFLSTGEKLVVFAHHREVQGSIYQAFEDRAVRITGGMDSQARQDAVDAFQSDDGVRLLVGSLQAAGIGITLTAASDVAFIELGWTPADHDQAEDRVHRIGQESDSVTAWYLLAEDTIDNHIAALIRDKREVVDQATEGGEDAETRVLDELVDELLTEESEGTDDSNS